MNVLVPVICSSCYSNMVSTSFKERFQASYVFPLDHNNLVIMNMFVTMIMITMSLVGTTSIIYYKALELKHNKVQLKQ